MCENVQDENDDTRASKFAFPTRKKKKYNSKDTKKIRCLEHIATHIDIRCKFSFIIARVYGLAGADNTSLFSFLFSDRSFLIIFFCHIFQDLCIILPLRFTLLSIHAKIYFCFVSLFLLFVT